MDVERRGCGFNESRQGFNPAKPVSSRVQVTLQLPRDQDGREDGDERVYIRESPTKTTYTLKIDRPIL